MPYGKLILGCLLVSGSVFGMHDHGPLSFVPQQQNMVFQQQSYQQNMMHVQLKQLKWQQHMMHVRLQQLKWQQHQAFVRQQQAVYSCQWINWKIDQYIKSLPGMRCTKQEKVGRLQRVFQACERSGLRDPLMSMLPEGSTLITRDNNKK